MEKATAKAKRPAGDYELSLRINRPLVGVQFAATAIGCSFERVVTLIDERKIPWAWDLAFKQYEGARPFIRIYTRSLMDYLHQHQQKDPNNPEHFKAVMDEILPVKAGWAQKFAVQTVTAKQLAAAGMSFDTNLMIRLWKAGIIKGAPGTKSFHGRGGSPRFLRSSVVEFFQNRRMA